MNEKLRKLVDRLTDIFEERLEDFTEENCEGDEIGVSDYCSNHIPIERVEQDHAQMVKILNEGKRILVEDDFYVLTAAFCNYYIEEGFDFVLQKEDFGLNSFFTTRDDKDIVFCIYKGITTQDYRWFESAYEVNDKCTAANMYLFVKGMSELTYAIATDKHISNLMEENVWKYYENLSDEWKDFAIQEVKNYPLMDKSPIPYICCASGKDHMTQMVTWYLQQILEELEVDIDEVGVDNLYNAISDKYGFDQAVKLTMDFSKECSEKYQFNLQPGQTEFPDDVADSMIEMQSKMLECFSEVAEILIEGAFNHSNTHLNTTFMYEKLGYMLLSSDDERKENAKFEVLPYPQADSSVLYRYSFLHLPAVPYDSISKNYILGRYKIFVSNRELLQKNKEIEALNEEKIDMMDYYAHSWKHISYPKIVKEVAEALLGKEDDDSITMANKLLRAYNSEQTLKHGIQLLQYSISADRETVRKEFKKGFLVIDSPKEDGIVGIEHILYESLDMVILRLMMEDIDTSRRMKKCRSKFENIDDLREEYTERFLKRNKDNENLLEWVNENLLTISLEISDEWKAVRLDKESFAAAQMTEIMIELITNILLHGMGDAKIELAGDFQSMSIYETNNCSNRQARKGGKGIKTLSKVIDKINFGSSIREGIVYKTEENQYSVCIKLDRRLVYRA